MTFNGVLLLTVAPIYLFHINFQSDFFFLNIYSLMLVIKYSREA